MKTFKIKRPQRQKWFNRRVPSCAPKHAAKLLCLLAVGKLQVSFSPWSIPDMLGQPMALNYTVCRRVFFFFTISIRRKARAVSLWKRLTYQWAKRQQSKTRIINLTGTQPHKKLVLVGLKFNELFNGCDPSSPRTSRYKRKGYVLEKVLPKKQKKKPKQKTPTCLFKKGEEKSKTNTTIVFVTS